MIGSLFDWNDDGDDFGENTYTNSSRKYLQKPHALRETLVDGTLCPVGLVNQGATCYLNSLLQSFHNVTELRSILYRCQLESIEAELNVDDEELSDFDHRPIPRQLRKLFTQMDVGIASSRETVAFTRAAFKWKGSEGTVQHDAHELVTKLLDLLQTQLFGIVLRNSAGELDDAAVAVTNLFQGSSIENSVRCVSCNHITGREEPFTSLNCQVKGFESLVDSLQGLFLNVERLDEGYSCDACGKVTPKELSQQLISLPPMLVINLRRFEYNTETWQRYKVTDPFEFPVQLDMNPYLANQKRTKGSGTAGESHNEWLLKRRDTVDAPQTSSEAFVDEDQIASMFDYTDSRFDDEVIGDLFQDTMQSSEFGEASDVIEIQTKKKSDCEESIDRNLENNLENNLNGNLENNLENNLGNKLEDNSNMDTTIHSNEDDTDENHQHHANEFNQILDNVYRLHSVIVHSGTGYSGHYIAYSRDTVDPNRWFKYDDSNVTAVSSNELYGTFQGRASAYILLYQQLAPSMACPYSPLPPQSIAKEVLLQNRELADSWLAFEWNQSAMHIVLLFPSANHDSFLTKLENSSQEFVRKVTKSLSGSCTVSCDDTHVYLCDADSNETPVQCVELEFDGRQSPLVLGQMLGVSSGLLHLRARRDIGNSEAVQANNVPLVITKDLCQLDASVRWEDLHSCTETVPWPLVGSRTTIDSQEEHKVLIWVDCNSEARSLVPSILNDDEVLDPIRVSCRVLKESVGENGEPDTCHSFNFFVRLDIPSSDLMETVQVEQMKWITNNNIRDVTPADEAYLYSIGESEQSSYFMDLKSFGVDDVTIGKQLEDIGMVEDMKRIERTGFQINLVANKYCSNSSKSPSELLFEFQTKPIMIPLHALRIRQCQFDSLKSGMSTLEVNFSDQREVTCLVGGMGAKHDDVPYLEAGKGIGIEQVTNLALDVLKPICDASYSDDVVICLAQRIVDEVYAVRPLGSGQWRASSFNEMLSFGIDFSDSMKNHLSVEYGKPFLVYVTCKQTMEVDIQFAIPRCNLRVTLSTDPQDSLTDLKSRALDLMFNRSGSNHLLDDSTSTAVALSGCVHGGISTTEEMVDDTAETTELWSRAWVQCKGKAFRLRHTDWAEQEMGHVEELQHRGGNWEVSEETEKSDVVKESYFDAIMSSFNVEDIKSCSEEGDSIIWKLLDPCCMDSETLEQFRSRRCFEATPLDQGHAQDCCKIAYGTELFPSLKNIAKLKEQQVRPTLVCDLEPNDISNGFLIELGIPLLRGGTSGSLNGFRPMPEVATQLPTTRDIDVFADDNESSDDDDCDISEGISVAFSENEDEVEGIEVLCKSVPLYPWMRFVDVVHSLLLSAKWQYTILRTDKTKLLWTRVSQWVVAMATSKRLLLVSKLERIAHVPGALLWHFDQGCASIGSLLSSTSRAGGWSGSKDFRRAKLSPELSIVLEIGHDCFREMLDSVVDLNTNKSLLEPTSSSLWEAAVSKRCLWRVWVFTAGHSHGMLQWPPTPVAFSPTTLPCDLPHLLLKQREVSTFQLLHPSVVTEMQKASLEGSIPRIAVGKWCVRNREVEELPPEPLALLLMASGGKYASALSYKLMAMERGPYYIGESDVLILYPDNDMKLSEDSVTAEELQRIKLLQDRHRRFFGFEVDSNSQAVLGDGELEAIAEAAEKSGKYGKRKPKGRRGMPKRDYKPNKSLQKRHHAIEEVELKLG